MPYEPNNEWGYDGSIDFGDLKCWGNGWIRGMGLPVPIPTTLRKGWKKRVGRWFYSERWLRTYGLLRHVEVCYCLCSDYANYADDVNLPIVQSDERDQKLLWAHAQLLQRAGPTLKPKKGQNNGNE